MAASTLCPGIPAYWLWSTPRRASELALGQSCLLATHGRLASSAELYS